jgi:tetratricopeptide (TPR) repeat protein/tRNA A-37 threonylcarbamoyl transferase component Bud32
MGKPVLSSEEDATARVPAPPTLAEARRPEQVGRYRLGNLIGQGGFGFVYEATDETLNRRVAVKLRRTPVNTNDRELDDLVHEAKMVAQLHHPNVVRVFDVGIVPAGTENLVDVFIVMEFLSGQSLKQWLVEEDPHTEDIIGVFLQVCDGLSAAHDAGIVHCDVKPANIVVTRGGIAKLLDFGLSLHTDFDKELETSSGRTSHQPRGGTPKYMAPETHLGLSVDASADQYSLGITLVEALTGSSPFTPGARSTLVEEKKSGISAEALKERGVPRALARTLAKMVEPSPESRYESVRDVAYELRTWKAPSPWWLVAGTTALLGVGAFVLREPPAPCAVHPEALAPLLERTEVLSQRWSLLAPTKAEAGSRLTARLDAYADAWAVAASSACVDGSVETRACLRDGLRGFASLLDVLEEGDTQRLFRFGRLADTLEPPAECNQPQNRGPTPDPSNPDLRLAVSEVRTDLVRARALQIAGDYESALALSNECLARATEADFKPLVAEALVRVAQAEGAAGHAGASADHFEQAYLLAEALRHDRVASKAAVALVDAYGGSQLFAPELARAWARRAEASLSRAETTERDRAALEYHLGSLAYELGDLESAAAHFSRSAEEFERLGAEHDVAAAELFGGWAELTLGNVARAEELMHRAHGRLREHSGPHHPDTLRAQQGLAGIQNQQHRYEVALANYSYVLQHSRDALPPDHPDLVVMLMGVGHCEFQVGMADAALSHLHDAYELAARSTEPGNLNSAGALSLLSLARSDLGMHDKALDGLQTVLEQYGRVIEPPSHQLANAYANVGLELAAVGRHDEAEASFDASLSSLNPDIEDGMQTSIFARRAQARVLAGQRPIASLRAVINAFDAGDTEPLHAACEFQLAKLIAEESPDEASALAASALARYLSFGMKHKAAEIRSWQGSR